MHRALALAVAFAFALAGASVAPAAEPDCDGPAPAAQPDTSAWTAREEANVICGEQRASDTAANPAFAAAIASLPPAGDSGGPPEEDPFRDPAAWQGLRFRSQPVAFTDARGQRLPGRVFRPCDATCANRPAGVLSPAPPYPGVIVVHGGSANQEMYLWGSEALAESGYMVLTFQIPEPDNAESDYHYPDTKDALDFLESTPDHPTREGDVNPLWRELARDRIGLVGHSAGGVAVSRLGQEDSRVSAIVSWDRAQSGPMPPGLRLRTPALFIVADFNCQRVPVCLPVPYETPPDPKGPGNKDEDFRRVAAAGVDTMKVALRAATHLDFTQFPPGTGSRYGAVTASYYTLAWFDRYLRAGLPGTGDLADDAFRRLTAARFDSSADVHNISGGTFDPQTGRNVPAHIAGQPVRDRLSFHFRSAWSFDRGRRVCEDMRAGCPAPAPPPLAGSSACSSRRVVLVTLPRVPRGDRARTVTVQVGGRPGRRVRVRRDGRAAVDLRGLPRTRVRVRVIVRTARGRTLRVSRVYRTCAPRPGARGSGTSR